MKRRFTTMAAAAGVLLTLTTLSVSAQDTASSVESQVRSEIRAQAQTRAQERVHEPRTGQAVRSGAFTFQQFVQQRHDLVDAERIRRGLVAITDRRTRRPDLIGIPGSAHDTCLALAE
jgi:hypothetical protein